MIGLARLALKNQFFFISLSQFLTCFWVFAASVDDLGACISLSDVPLIKRSSRLAVACASLYEEHGYVGLNLRSFKEADIEKAYVFPDGEKINISRFRHYFMKKEKADREIGYENVFLFLLKPPKLKSISVEIYTASTYHHINDMVSVFRGEAPCYRQSISYILATADLPQFLSTPLHKGVLADQAYAIYDRFLTKEVSTALGSFLASFVQEISNRDTSK